MLNNFFRINLPYGLMQNENGDWWAFNREYLPLGFNIEDSKHFRKGQQETDLPVCTKYVGITEKFLLEISHDPDLVNRDKNGKIYQVWLYNDGSNPTNQSQDKKMLWDKYFEKLKKLSKLKVKS